MKSYELRKRLRKTRSRVGFVGFLYLIATLAITGLAAMPMFTINGTRLWSGNFWWYIKEAIKAPRDWFSFSVATVYGVMLLIVAINFFRCFGKLGKLYAKRAKEAKGYNRNLCAMDEMGKLFSSSFFVLAAAHFLIFIAHPIGAVKVTKVADLTMGVFLFFHFVCGLLGGKTSVFNHNKLTNEVVEEKRPCKLFVYFFRNLVQVAAVCAIVFYFVWFSHVNEIVSIAFNKTNPFRGGVMKVTVPMALELAMVLWILVLIKHTSNVTEFNRFGIDGDGMKNFRVFSFLLALTAGGWYALERFYNKTNPSWAFAIIAGVAFVAFLIDCIFKSKPPKKEENEEEQPAIQQPQYPCMQPMVMPAQNAPVQIYQQPAQQSQYQPIYIPIYCPYPQPPYAQQQSAPVASVMPMDSVEAAYAQPLHNVMPPMPAPEYIRPMPSPYALAMEQQKAQEPVAPTPSVEEEKEDEPVHELDPRKEWRVRCPRCGKELMVRETTPYHRCPACDKVFKLQRFRTYTKKTEE